MLGKMATSFHKLPRRTKDSMTSIAETPAPAVPQPSGLQYAVRILIGCAIVWFVLNRINHPSPLWALISVIIVTEPELSAAFLAFNSRIVNTLIGCAIGLSFLTCSALRTGPFSSASLSRLSSAPVSSAYREAGALLVTYVASLVQRLIRRAVS